MDTLNASIMAAAHRGQRIKRFDFNKAVDIIIEQKLIDVSAGLQSDLEYTEGQILRDGKPVDEGAYLGSNWATPVLITNYDEIECWSYEDEMPGSGHEWPESAKEKLAKALAK